MQVQILEQTIFNSLIFGKFRFLPKKFYNINYWSSGYGRRHMSKRFESQSAILDGLFLTFICCKIVLMFEKTENKRKIGRDWPIKHDGQRQCDLMLKLKVAHVFKSCRNNNTY